MFSLSKIDFIPPSSSERKLCLFKTFIKIEIIEKESKNNNPKVPSLSFPPKVAGRTYFMKHKLRRKIKTKETIITFENSAFDKTRKPTNPKGYETRKPIEKKSNSLPKGKFLSLK